MSIIAEITNQPMRQCIDNSAIGYKQNSSLAQTPYRHVPHFYKWLGRGGGAP